MSTAKKTSQDLDNDISPTERKLLDDSLDMDINGDDADLQRAALDNTDDDGELLDEASSADDLSGSDLDIPGTEEDDADEEIGEEDEENNGYSEADTA